jgi:hypothetical protein
MIPQRRSNGIMMPAQSSSRRKNGEHCGSNSGNRIQYGACFGAHFHRCGPTFLCVPLERVHAPTALFERVVSGLIDGRRTLKDAGVEQDFGFSANDGVIGFDFVETRNRSRFKHGPLSTGREKSEQEIQGREQKNMIGKIFVQRKTVPAPQIQIREGTNVNDHYNCEWIVYHSRPHRLGPGLSKNPPAKADGFLPVGSQPATMRSLPVMHVQWRN